MEDHRRRIDDLTPEEEIAAARYEVMSEREKNEFYRRALDALPTPPAPTKTATTP